MAEKPGAWIPELARILQANDLQITFSINCYSGIAHVLPPGDRECECWRCRKERGLESSEETENLARERSQLAQKLFKEEFWRWLDNKNMS